MEELTIKREAVHAADYDVIVAGGGVAGVAAAVSARRLGRSVLLIEKTVGLGGLATTGLINLFVPMCNGRGVQIIKGMAEELLRLSVKYGYDTVPKEWKNGEPGLGKTNVRYVTRFSAPIFTLALTEFVVNEGVDLLFDTIITEPIMDGKVCRGVVTENKTGCRVYGAKFVIDATGDADLLYRAGVPTVQGKNFHSYFTMGADIDSCREAAEKRDISKLYGYKFNGGDASLYGDNHPKGKPLRDGTTAEDITEYFIENHIECLEKLKKSERGERTIVTLPTMPQFRTTRHIDGDYTLKEEDAYKHFDDSIAAICDFDRRDYLYEVPLRTMLRAEYPNLITAGRSVAAEGHAWDILRVIPPAILTGQAAGVVSAMAADGGCAAADVNIAALQAELERGGVMIHFDDALVPSREAEDLRADIGHI